MNPFRVTTDSRGNSFASIDYGLSPQIYFEVGPAVRHGQTIAIDVYQGDRTIPGFGYPQFILPQTAVVPLGHLPAGAYTLTTTNTLGFAQVISFTV
jgi:hypothetical protein